MAKKSGNNELSGEPHLQIGNGRNERRQRLARQIGQLLAQIWLQRRRENQIRNCCSNSTVDMSQTSR